MNLIVFGATGKVGRQLADQALSQGHRVTAFTRTPDKLEKSHENLRIVEGDVLDPDAVRAAMQGHDGVLCALGMPLMNKENLRANGTRNIVRAMEETGVRRIVCLSALGTGDSRATLPAHYRYLLAPLIMRHMYADHERQEGLIKNSPLDWVIVRPGNFTEGGRNGAYRHGFTKADRSLKLKISVADVAEFMLKQLADNTYLHRAPGLSY